MKLFGQQVTGPNVETLVIPRQDFDIVILAQAILDDKHFDDLCPRPKPTKVLKAGSGEWTEDTKDEEFVKQLNNWGIQHTSWTVITSLRATPKETLEWEKVKLDDPSTWNLWREELREAYFTDYEVMLIQNLVFAANGLNQQKLDEARNRFLVGQVRPHKPLPSPKVEQQTIPSGEPAKDSV